MIQFFAKRMKNKKGFTLVELLIVIAVMGILAAIAMPRFLGVTQSFKERADKEAARIMARQVEILIQTGKIEKKTVIAATAAKDVTADEYGEAFPDSQSDSTKKLIPTYKNKDAKSATVAVYRGTGRDAADQVFEKDVYFIE